MNNRKIVAAGFVAVIAVLVAVMALISQGNASSDQDQILAALQRSIEDSKDGRPGGVIDLIDRHLQVNGEAVEVQNRTIAKLVRAQKPEVVVSDPRPLVTGDEARIVSPVNIKFSILGQTVERKLASVTLIFRREVFRDWGITPRSKWRLAEVQAPEDVEQNWPQ